MLLQAALPRQPRYTAGLVTARPSPATAALAVILLAAAALRLAGIGHHLRYGAPDFDERNNFVDPVLRMWSVPTADPTVYLGYAGFFNWLIFLPVGLGKAVAGETGAYVAARLVVALFGILSVWLVYVAARRLTGEWPALAGAALLAVARIAVRHTHHITPDILVGTAGLAVIALAQAAPRRRRDILIGALVGAATATKYSGLLLAPAAAAVVLWERRPRALAVIGLSAGLAFALAAPYALLQVGQEGGTGFAGGLETYFGADTESNRFLQGSGTSIQATPSLLTLSLGVPACVIALFSVLGWARPPVAAAWAIVMGMVAATIPANLVNPRHVIPAETAAAFLFCVGLARLGRRPAVVAVLATTAVISPVGETVELVARYLRPAAVDQAAEWIDGHVPGPALVATSLSRLRLPPERFEVRLLTSLDEIPRVALPHYDLLVATTVAEVDFVRVPALASFPSEEGHEGRPVTVMPAPHRGPMAVLPPDRMVFSRHDAGSERAWDGRGDTCWAAPGGELTIEAEWDTPRVLERIDVEAAAWPEPLRLFGLDELGRWLRLDLDSLRPTRAARQRVGSRFGQIYVLAPPRRLSALRIERGPGLEWSLCEVRLSGAL